MDKKIRFDIKSLVILKLGHYYFAGKSSGSIVDCSRYLGTKWPRLKLMQVTVNQHSSAIRY